MYIAVAVALVVVAIFAYLGFFGVSGTTQEAPVAQTSAQDLLNQISAAGKVETLQVIDTAVGTGAEAKAGDTITVHYIGVLPDGTVFDASQNRGQPFTFTLGGGQVIKGWDQGLLGMKVGGTRLVAIPPELAYGERAIGQIPSNASLIFQVELLSIGEPAPAPQQ